MCVHSYACKTQLHMQAWVSEHFQMLKTSEWWERQRLFVLFHTDCFGLNSECTPPTSEEGGGQGEKEVGPTLRCNSQSPSIHKACSSLFSGVGIVNKRKQRRVGISNKNRKKSYVLPGLCGVSVGQGPATQGTQGHLRAYVGFYLKNCKSSLCLFSPVSCSCKDSLEVMGSELGGCTGRKCTCQE